MKNKRRNIFIGPGEVAGYYANFANGFSELGVDCDYITFGNHPINYGCETRSTWLLRLAKHFNNFCGKPNRPFIAKALFSLHGAS